MTSINELIVLGKAIAVGVACLYGLFVLFVSFWVARNA